MKILASDLDGTLVKLSEENKLIINGKDIEALKVLRDKGNKFVVSTGRDYNSTVDLMKENNIKYDYLVLCNGALVIDNDENEIIKNKMEFNVFKEIINLIYENDDMKPYVNAGKKSFVIEDRTDKGELRDGLSRVSKEELIKEDRGCLIIGMHPKDRSKERAEEIRDIIDQKYGEYVEVYRNNCYVDVVAKGSSKGQALKRVINLLNTEEDKLYTIGDSFNDIPMFNITPNSYTFYNSEEVVKESANNLVEYVYECINDIIK